MIPIAHNFPRRFERPAELPAAAVPAGEPIRYERAAEALSGSALSPGGRALLLGLLRTGTTRVFPGGGVGIEYGSLLKTAVRPDDLGAHVREAAAHLRAAGADLLLVPGMSGYPVGAMYALAAELPAVLLKKGRLRDDEPYPRGAFVIPSYTGAEDVVMSADLEAVRDIVGAIAQAKLAVAPAGAERIALTLRCAGADDIIDKATMAHAITESAPLFCDGALGEAVDAYRARTGDRRPIDCRVETVAWVAPLIKTYNGAVEHLRGRFGITPFAGVAIASVHLDPPAIGVEGAGVFAFRGVGDQRSGVRDG